MGFGWRAVALLGLSVLVQGSWPPNSTLHCQPDDSCLLQFRAWAPTSVTAFCASYTMTMNTATTGMPRYVANCRSNPSRISSACSCVVTAPPPATTSPPPSWDCEGTTETTTVTDVETCYVTITAPVQTYTVTYKYVQRFCESIFANKSTVIQQLLRMYSAS
jgi:hypothetical protein